MKYSVKISRVTLAFFGAFLTTCDTIEEEKTPTEFPFSDLQLTCTSSPCEFTESTKPGGYSRFYFVTLEENYTKLMQML